MRVTVLIGLGLIGGCAPHPARMPAAGHEVATVQRAPNLDLARQTLVTAAADLDVSVRRRALAILIQTSPQPAGGDWGPRGLWDPNPWVERAAIDALAQRISEPASQRLLIEMTRRTDADPYTRCQAAFRLAQAGDRQTLPTVQAAYRAAGAPWRAAPCALAAARMGDRDALATLGAALRQGELPLDIPFLQDVGDSGLTELVPALTQAADTVEEPLRLGVAGALLRLGAPEGAVIFREALRSPDREQRLEALDYLLTIPGPSALELLRHIKAEPGLAGTYARLALLARGEGSPEIAWKALQSDDREARMLAVRCLGYALARWKDEGTARHWRHRALAALRKALDDPEDEVRIEVVLALARAGDSADLPSVAALLEADRADLLHVEAAGATLLLSARAG